VFHTKRVPQMDPSCRLSTRCLKKDEPLEACNSSGCQNPQWHKIQGQAVWPRRTKARLTRKRISA